MTSFYTNPWIKFLNPLLYYYYYYYRGLNTISWSNFLRSWFGFIKQIDQKSKDYHERFLKMEEYGSVILNYLERS